MPIVRHCRNTTTSLHFRCSVAHLQQWSVAQAHLDVEKLYAALDGARRERNLSWRGVAREIGVSPSLLSRMANGRQPDTSGFIATVEWLRMPAEDFFSTRQDGESQRDPAVMAQMSALLRTRKDLSKADVDYLESIISAAVTRIETTD